MREDILKSEDLEQAIWLSLFASHEVLIAGFSEEDEGDRLQEIVTSLRAYVEANPT